MAAHPAAVPLRPAREKDLSGLRALETCCFGLDAWGEEALRGELGSVPATRYVVVAEHAGTLVGYAALLAVGFTADVQRVAVRPDWRRQGIGADLLAELLREARERGCVEALLEVREDNPAALAMYEAAGFGVLARRQGYYRDGAHALVLRLAPIPARRAASDRSR
jgi:[ribosomal protein S18]-alanine N-acetyltransferase